MGISARARVLITATALIGGMVGAAPAAGAVPFLDAFIAPGVNRTDGGFGTASVVVPAGESVTFLVRTDASFAGRAIQIWTRSRTADWSAATTRLVDAHGALRYFARVTEWTAFRAVAFEGGVRLAASHGRIATAGPATFALEVLPPEVPSANRRAIGGQQYRFLVRLHDRSPDRGSVLLAASAPGAAVHIAPALLRRGVVGEVTVVPAAVAGEAVQSVIITATRDGDPRVTVRRTIELTPGEDTDAAAAREHLALFLPWLATNRPALGLTPTTSFEGTSASHLLVVTHYLFVSEEWEVGLSWHVMIARHDWTRIYLRHRWTEAWPSLAFEIGSVAGGAQPVEVDPPTAITR